MKTNQDIVSRLELEYQNKRRQNEMKMQKRRKALYEKHPKLEEIDNQINLYYLEIMKNSLEENYSNAPIYKKIEDLKKEKQELILSEKIDIAKMDLEYECNICKDTGIVENRGKTSRCQCYINRYNAIAYENTNMLKLVTDCNFDKFNIDIFDNSEKIGKFTQREFMQKMKDKSLSFIENFNNKEEKSMIFYGSTGLGKSYLCLCIAEKLIKRRKNVVYETSIELFDKLANYVFSSSENIDNAIAVFNSLVHNCDLLIIDDLGTEITNAFVKNQLFNIINTRAINGKKTIISTNLSPAQLQELYEQRVYSRISRFYNVYKFIGKDLRIFGLR